jgi:hypothetical protein
MPQDDDVIASQAARIREQIRTDLERRLRVLPAPADGASAKVRAAATMSIPETADRPELSLGEQPLPQLTLPAALKPGLCMAYDAMDRVRGSLRWDGYGFRIDRGSGDSGSGYTNAHVVVADGQLVCFDVRRYFISDPRDRSPVSINPVAVVGDALSAGRFWIHPAALARLSGERRPKQAEDVTVTRLPFETEGGARFNAVRISQTQNKGNRLDEALRTTVYDLDTGLLLLSINKLRVDEGHELLSFRAQRQLQIPWANQPAPEWVGKTRGLLFEGANTIVFPLQQVRLGVTLSADLSPVAPGVVVAKFTVVLDAGGIPGDTSYWDMVCAPAMIYPLWIAPAALTTLKPQQLIDDDPITGFRMTFAGIDGDYAAIAEEGKLERTTYYFNVRTGMFSGMRGQRPYASGGGQMHTETWFKSQR